MIIHQPYDKPLGEELITNLESSKYSVFKFAVAYAKVSAVNLLLPSMRKFKEAGGKISAVIGVDQGITSYEALVSLNKICDELYIYHSEDFLTTFHVKTYYFEGDAEIWCSFGSNNLTSGGLFSNFEASLCISEKNKNSSLKRQFDVLFSDYSNTASPCCVLADDIFIDSLLKNNYVSLEPKDKARAVAEYKKSSSKKKKKLFGFERHYAPSLKTRTQTPSKIVSKTAVTVPSPAISSEDFSYKDYLIRHVPKAGNRSQQVHFNMDY